MDPQLRFAVALTGLVFAVPIDIFSAVLTVRRITRGHGSSGLHMLSGPLYLVAIFLTLEPVVLRFEPWYLFKILEVALIVSFHLSLGVLLPVLLQRYTPNKE